MDKTEIILNKYFGFGSFRGLQETIIKRTTEERKHSLVLMPTGSGKSLCYQIPALYFENKTIVISPLIALMQDQVDALRKKNVPAAFINSTLSKQERGKRLEDFLNGNIKILYVTPERFRKKDFIEKIKTVKIDLLAVDEAHCISEWGHDFRPDYSRIGEFREILGNPLTIALTATATKDVQEDILVKLNLNKDEVKIFHQGIDRPNLRLEAADVFDDKEKLKEILAALKKYNGSGIIYFSLIKTLEKFSEMIGDRGFERGIYHGKLEDKQRKQMQRDFLGGKQKLILATNAFGMGIDKADIRLVIHAEVPSSIESYYQEIGRAGRDGKDSLCLLLYNQEDLYTQMEFIKWSNPDADFYFALYNLLQRDTGLINSSGIDLIREQMNFKSKNDFRIETALAMLDRYGVTEGEIEKKNLKVIDELPGILQDEEFLKKKLLNDNKKLLSVVNYFRNENCRRVFISDYFGFPGEKPCGNCDNCV
ncbi:MAG: ATP-dependent DNA helicase [Ignavibacteriales bacterium]|jgi:ATP-dependent DNA helicase RecQ|nr:ATP-dependent DNA helicase RecQ [Ignavibacteriaceae bacterium]MEB2354009.1 ATP-dependent DNA helicase [Ignavibacteriales bacterium]